MSDMVTQHLPRNLARPSSGFKNSLKRRRSLEQINTELKTFRMKRKNEVTKCNSVGIGQKLLTTDKTEENRGTEGGKHGCAQGGEHLAQCTKLKYRYAKLQKNGTNKWTKPQLVCSQDNRAFLHWTVSLLFVIMQHWSNWWCSATKRKTTFYQKTSLTPTNLLFLLKISLHNF